MSNHKNTLKTAWNDVTGDTIKTGKGSQEKYAANWDAIFGKKKVEPRKLEASLCVACSEPVIYLEELKHDPIRCPSCGNMFSVYHGSGEPTTVMALDFHDSRPVKHNFIERMSESLDSPSVKVPQGLDREALRAFILQEAEQAREDAWRDAVMLSRQVLDSLSDEDWNEVNGA